MHGFASPAPWPAYPGGYLFQSAYLNVHEGINDSHYLHTLTPAIKSCKATGKHSAMVQKAEAFLAELRQVIPEFSEIAGLQGEGQGALVGQSILSSAAGRTGEWRARIAEFLKVLLTP